MNINQANTTDEQSRARAAEEARLLACVHCGLCLEACPTYVHTGDENDNPRGRIYLMRAVHEGRLPASSPAFERHINRCLGCLACERACPAGVEYGHLLETAREHLTDERAHDNFMRRALRLTLRHVWMHPARLRLMFNSLRLLRDTGAIRLLLKLRFTAFISRRARFAFALLDASADARHTGTANQKRARTMRDDAPLPSREMKPVSFFTGCVMETLFNRVNGATRRVLAVNGCTVSAPAGQVCCGALHAHAGELEEARRLARRNIDAFTDTSDAPIVTNAGGCGAMLLSYGELLEGDAEYAARAREFSRRVRDVSQQLATTGIRSGAPLESGDVGRTITYDASCHLINKQHADQEPLRMLTGTPDVQFVPLASEDVCCGGAGVYNLLEPELSARVLDAKLADIRATGATELATGNPGCHMQIAAGARLAGMKLKVCHPVEILDESYERAGFYEEMG